MSEKFTNYAGLPYSEVQDTPASVVHPSDTTDPLLLGAHSCNVGSVTHSESVGHPGGITLLNTADRLTSSDDAGPDVGDTQPDGVSVVTPKNPAAIQEVIAQRADLIAGIREKYRQRCALLNAEKKLTLQIKALCRRAVGGEDLKEAQRLYKDVDEGFKAHVKQLKNKDAESHEFEHPMSEVLSEVAFPLMTARASVSTACSIPEKWMVKHAEMLPVMEFVDGISGFGWLGLAQIIGEAGDLSNYSNPAKLWRRMGLAPYKDKALSQWRVKGGLTASDWEEAGYSPRRRSLIYVIGDSLIKKQNVYRDLYLQKKGEQAEKHPDRPKMAHHLWAQRYVEKRLLRELWKAWRDATNSEALEVETSWE